jgi:arabinofuranosyltransferase
VTELRYFRRVWERLRRLKKFGPLALVVLLGVALVVHASYYFPFISDDALISLRYSRRFAQGLGLTWTDGERVEGYTNLLWVLLNGACSAVGFDLVWSARVLDTLGVLFAIVCASVVPRPLALSPVRALSGGLFFAFASPLAVWAVGGLEHGFLAGVLAGALVALARIDDEAGPRPRACFVAGAFLGAVALLRADGLVLVLTATSGFALAGKLRLRVLGQAALVLAIPIGLLGLQLLFRWLYYGSLVPNTALAKVSFNEARLIGGLYYLRDGFRPLLPAISLTLVLLAAGFRALRPERTLPPLVVLVGWSSYVGLVGGDIFPGWRQLVPSVVALGMLLAEAAHAASSRFRFGVPAVLGVTLPVLVFGLVFQTKDRENVRAKNELWEHDGRPLGYLLKKAFSAKKPLLAVDAAGALPYWSELPCLDLLGLNDRYIATHPPPNFGHGGIGHELGDGAYVLRRRPDLIAFNGSVGGRSPMFLSGIQLVATREFQREYQLVLARGPRARPVGELWIRREGGKVGVARGADRIEVPGYFFAHGAALAELDAKHRLVANNPGPYNAELPKFELPAGTWEMLLDTDIATGGVAFRCDGVSAAPTGVGKTSIELEAPRAVDVIVGAAPKGVVAIRAATFVRRSEPGGFRCAARGDRLTVPLSQLSKRKEARSDWSALSNVLIQTAGLRVVVPELSHAKSLELSVDGNDRYMILFARGSQVEGSVTLEHGKGGGMSIERVTVPAAVQASGFNRVEVVPLEGDGYYAVGHLLLRTE